MLYRDLGRTGQRVSAVSLGTGPLGGLFGDVDDHQAIDLVKTAIDLGVNFFDTSPYYGRGEELLGQALVSDRDKVLVGTKVGLYGNDDADFSALRIRSELEKSLTLLKTEYVDVLLLHDIENGNLDQVLTEGYEEVVRLRDAGKCRFIGVSGYALTAMRRALRDSEIDVLLTYAHGTLLDDSFSDDLGPIANGRGVGLINAAAVAFGLLSNKTKWLRRDFLPDGTEKRLDHPATPEIRSAASKMRELCAERGTDIGEFATRYSIQRIPSATTLIGTTSLRHLRSAVEAVSAPIDEELLTQLLALRTEPGGWPGKGEDS